MDIGALRLQNQQIANARLKTPEQVVAWMGGMQGQDYPGKSAVAISASPFAILTKAERNAFVEAAFMGLPAVFA